MQWIAPSEENVSTDTLGNRLWAAAGRLRANSGLTSAQYSTPVLGLIFLRFAYTRFAKRRATLEKTATFSRRGSRLDDPAAYHAKGVLYLTPNARFVAEYKKNPSSKLAIHGRRKSPILSSSAA